MSAIETLLNRLEQKVTSAYDQVNLSGVKSTAAKISWSASQQQPRKKWVKLKRLKEPVYIYKAMVKDTVQYFSITMYRLADFQIT